MSKIKQKCKFYGCLLVESNGSKGGLCLFWKEGVDLTMKSYSHHHMDSHICWLDKSWRFTGTYGYP